MQVGFRSDLFTLHVHPPVGPCQWGVADTHRARPGYRRRPRCPPMGGASCRWQWSGPPAACYGSSDRPRSPSWRCARSHGPPSGLETGRPARWPRGSLASGFGNDRLYAAASTVTGNLSLRLSRSHLVLSDARGFAAGDMRAPSGPGSFANGTFAHSRAQVNPAYPSSYPAALLVDPGHGRVVHLDLP